MDAIESKKPRGFALLTPEQRRVMGSRGGKSGHAQGKGHRFTREEAQAAALKGVAKRQAQRTATDTAAE